MHASRALINQERNHEHDLGEVKKKLRSAETEIAALAPDSSMFEIVEALEVTGNLIVKVRYQSCSKCAFEGDKTMVYVGKSPIDALKWRRIDPHFSDIPPATASDAPSPDARFPPTPDGWADAIIYARGK